MDEIFAEQALNPKFKEAFLELKNKSTYISEGERLIAITSDRGTWVPHKHLIEYVPNLNEIEVILLADIKLRTQLLEVIKAEREVGMVLMGPTLDRHNRPYMIVITTRWAYYAIDPDNAKEIRFLLAMLNEPELKVYMSNCLREADCLKGCYNLDLNIVKASLCCATGTHVYMMQFMKHMTEPCLAKYPSLVQECVKLSREVKIESDFGNLVEMWLDIYKRRIAFSEDRLVQLKTRPLSDTAKNIIKKRACLVKVLNEVIDYYSMVEFQWSSELLYNTLTICNDDVARDVRKAIIGKDRDAEILFHHYQNYGTGLTTEKYKIIPEILEADYETDSED